MSNESNDNQISPELRKRLQELFETGNRQMTQGNYDYAAEIYFTPCVLGDPGNMIYMQTFIGNMRKKHGEKKKKGTFSFISSAGLKTAETRKQWKGVLEAGLKLIRANPWDADTFFSMGKACFELGYTETGLAYIKHAIDCNPKDLEANRFAGRKLRELKLYDDALACWNRILSKIPNDEEATKAMSDILVEKTIKTGAYDVNERDKNIATKSARENDDSLDVMGRKLTPEQIFERDLKKAPNNIKLFIEHADRYFQAGEYKKAEEVFHRALEIEPNNSELKVRLMETEKKQLLDEVLRIKSEFEKTKKTELREQFNQAKTKLDKKTLEVAKFRVKTEPSNTSNHFELGNIYRHTGHYKEAITEYQIAVQDVSRAGECLLALGQCFQQINMYPLAMKHYKQAIDSIKDKGENKKKALYLAARLAYGLKDYSAAEELASELAAIDFSYKDVGELLDKVTQKRDN